MLKVMMMIIIEAKTTIVMLPLVVMMWLCAIMRILVVTTLLIMMMPVLLYTSHAFTAISIAVMATAGILPKTMAAIIMTRDIPGMEIGTYESYVDELICHA
jgi:hypothetical protein